MAGFCLERLAELARRHSAMDRYGIDDAEQIQLQEQLFELQARIAGYDLRIFWNAEKQAYSITGTVGVK